MDLFRVFSNKTTPKDVAKDRLRLILIHDRGDIPEETIEKIRSEILEVLAKYIEIECEDVEISVTVPALSSFGVIPRSGRASLMTDW